MTTSSETVAPGLPGPLVIPAEGAALDDLLQREWLIANQIGAYASGTVVGCNTRRYHGLLIGARTPPTGRVLALSTVAEQLEIDDGTTCDLSTFEFSGTFSPRGVVHLREFRNDVAATFILRAGPLELTKEVLPAEDANAVAIRYTVRGGRAVLRLRPFAALRDFHALREADAQHQVTFEQAEGGVVVQDRAQGICSLYLQAGGAEFKPDPQWWYRFCYRVEIARGQEGFEDLYAPGHFVRTLEDGESCQLTAALGEPMQVNFEATHQRRAGRLEKLAASVGPDAGETTRRLAVAADAFVVNRHFPGRRPSRTILAGFHWFADWGRDAFIALPGLLLETGRFEEARQVFRTFADRLEAGMIPNRFDDYSDAAHYNSIDASLWFILAAERYLRAGGDEEFWHATLLPTALAILTAYHDGTRFDIHADSDGLLVGGSPGTQLTWMDAALGDEVITPRHDKAVEINALWYCAHRVVAERAGGTPGGESAAHRAELIAGAFERTFWNADGGYLYDCVREDHADASIRPNQVFAVSLPYSPLSPERQEAVVETVRRELLTPRGLRSLAPGDPRYRRRYGGSQQSRDRAYHQGTVWAWLMGPFIEAFLRVHDFDADAARHARRWLEPFDEHLTEAGVGLVSEIFDGDPPHPARGCIAQAWSVGELLRAWRLVERAGP